MCTRRRVMRDGHTDRERLLRLAIALSPATVRARQSTWLPYAAAFAGYLLITCAALWALLSQFTTAVPGGRDTDYFQFHWGYWWIEHALSEGVSPMWTDYVFYPHVSNLSMHTLAPIWYPLYAIAKPLVGQIAAVNLMVLLAYPLSGIAMFAWLRRLLDARSDGVAFLGGLAYAFSPMLMTHGSYTHLNLIPLWWFPLILLLWDELAYPRRFSRVLTAVLLGLALWGLWLSDLQFIVWIPFVALGYVLWTLWQARRGEWLRLVGWGVVVLAIMAALAWVYPVSALVQVDMTRAEFPPAGAHTLEVYSVPLSALVGLAPPVETRTLGRVIVWLAWGSLGLMVFARRKAPHPPARSPLRERGGVTTHEHQEWLQENLEESPLYQEVERELRVRWKRPPALLWLLMALVPLVFSFGPTLDVGGAKLPMPYMLQHNLLNGQSRVPSRLTGAVMALLLTFLAVAWTPYALRLARRNRALAFGAAVVVGVLLLADNRVFTPFPTRAVPTHPIHAQIAQDKREYVVLDVPLGIQYGWTGIGEGFESMFYGAYHEHPMVNGWLSRIPYSTLDSYIDSPLYSYLAGERELDGSERAAAADELSTYIRDYPIGYVFAYRDDMQPNQQSDWIGWLNQHPDLCPAESSPDMRLLWWRTDTIGCADPSITTDIDIGGADWTHIGYGWYDPETIGGPQGRWAKETATLRLTLDPDTAYDLTFSAVAFGEGRSVMLAELDTRVELSSADWDEYTIHIPAGALPDGLLTLRHNGATSTATVGVTEGARDLAAAYDRVSLRQTDG